METVYSQIFEDYNKLIENTFNELMVTMGEDEDNYFSDDLITLRLNEKQIPWQKEAKSYLNGSTPEQCFSLVKVPEMLMDIFEQAAILCDKDIPVALADVLVNCGEEINKKLLDIVFDEEYRRDSESVVVAAAALYVLGRTKRGDILESLLKLLTECTIQDELLMESITSAIKQYGNKALETVMDFIEKQDSIDFKTEYLIMILPDISSENKSDKVYRLLKSSFLKMENKILGASALADYGDGRAIPVLRGYIEKTIGTIDKETFYELKKSIETLGGSTEDLIRQNVDNTSYNNLFR